jgi:hypothetical protein
MRSVGGTVATGDEDGRVVGVVGDVTGSLGGAGPTAGAVVGVVPPGPAVGGVDVPELPGAAWATTAVTAPIAAIDPATSHLVTRETRRRPESRSYAPKPATGLDLLRRSWTRASQPRAVPNLRAR